MRTLTELVTLPRAARDAVAGVDVAEAQAAGDRGVEDPPPPPLGTPRRTTLQPGPALVRHLKGRRTLPLPMPAVLNLQVR